MRTSLLTSPVLVCVSVLATTRLAPAQSAPPKLDPSLVKRVEASAAAEFARTPVGALSISIVAPSAAETRHWGHVDGAGGPAPTGSTVYRIGSITKNFTALAFLKLEASDRLNFSDSVERFVPQFADIQKGPPSKAKVTLIQLATHTGGLARDLEDGEPFQIGAVGEWKRTLIAAVPNVRYMADPGSLFSYSNVGYGFLGAALEAAAEMPYTRYLTEQVLTPLAMSDTVFELSAEQRGRLALGWTISKLGASTSESEAELVGRGYRVPAGGLFSTLDDMTRWLRFQMGEPNPKVLAAQALADAQGRFVTTGPRLDSGYGIGLQLRRLGEVVVRGHSGGVPGYQAEMYFEPERKFGVVILRSAVFGEFDVDAILAAAFAAAR